MLLAMIFNHKLQPRPARDRRGCRIPGRHAAASALLITGMRLAAAKR